MNELDISKTFCVINGIRRTAYSKMRRFSEPFYVNDRHSDAFVYVISGQCSYVFPEHAFTAEDGDMIYLSKGESYEMNVTSERYDVIFCDFDFEGDKKRKSALFKPQSSSICEKEFTRLYRAWGQRSNAEAMSHLYSVYSLLCSCNDGEGGEVPKKITTARSEMERRFSDPSFSIYSLADGVGMSEVYLRKLFTKHYGIQPIKYINDLRIKKAKEILKYSLITVDECARESGFSSPQYFCRAFKKATGITPGEYRKKKYEIV